MKCSPFLEQIVAAQSELELRAHFLNAAGQAMGAKAWGWDFLNYHGQVLAADLVGLPDRFKSDYQTLGQTVDSLSRLMIEQHIPVHNLSIYTPQHWKRTRLYQDLFRPYGMESAMVGPLIGQGYLMGGIYFLRDRQFPPFCDRDLLYLSTLCQYISVRLATLQIPVRMADLPHSSGLTRRELEIADLVAQGLTNREIGICLNISQEGVKQALKRMFRKLNVSARSAMVAKLKG